MLVICFRFDFALVFVTPDDEIKELW
jgi:hypothetical protein